MMTSSDKKSKIFLKEKFVSIYETFFKVKTNISLLFNYFFLILKNKKGRRFQFETN